MTARFFFLCGDVLECACETGHILPFENRFTDGSDPLTPAFLVEEGKLKVEGTPFPDAFLDCILDDGSRLWSVELNGLLHRGSGEFGVEPVDPIGLLRPEELVLGQVNVPAPDPGHFTSQGQQAPVAVQFGLGRCFLRHVEDYTIERDGSILSYHRRTGTTLQVPDSPRGLYSEGMLPSPRVGDDPFNRFKELVEILLKDEFEGLAGILDQDFWLQIEDLPCAFADKWEGIGSVGSPFELVDHPGARIGDLGDLVLEFRGFQLGNDLIRDVPVLDEKQVASAHKGADVELEPAFFFQGMAGILGIERKHFALGDLGQGLLDITCYGVGIVADIEIVGSNLPL